MSEIPRQRGDPLRSEHSEPGTLSEGVEASVVILSHNLPDIFPPLFVASLFEGEKPLKIERLGSPLFGESGFLKKLQLFAGIPEAPSIQKGEYFLRLKGENRSIPTTSFTRRSSTGAVIIATSSTKTRRESEREAESNHKHKTKHLRKAKHHNIKSFLNLPLFRNRRSGHF